MKYVLLTNPHNNKDLLINLSLVTAIEEQMNGTKIWTNRRVYEVKESFQEVTLLINEIQMERESINSYSM